MTCLFLQRWYWGVFLGTRFMQIWHLARFVSSLQLISYLYIYILSFICIGIHLLLSLQRKAIINFIIFYCLTLSQILLWPLLKPFPKGSKDTPDRKVAAFTEFISANYQAIIIKMSDIDLSQPIFQSQYACSERNSVPDPSSSEPNTPSHPPQTYHYNHNQINLLKPAPSYRLSQTTISKRSSPVKVNTSLLKSQENPFSNFDPSEKPDDRKTNSSFLASINQSDTFECQHKLHMNSVCEICKGKGFVKGDSNLIKFFQYVIGFKFGINQSYSSVRLLKRKRTEVNNFCSQFYTKGEEQQIRGTVNNCGFQISSKSNRSSHGVPSKNNVLTATNPGVNLSNSLRITNIKSNRQSLNTMGRMSFKSTKKCNKDELMDQINNTLTIHQDYVCDVCEVQPIVGARFHCNECEDFDLCGDCYRKSTHEHMMEKIEKSAKGAQLQNVVNLLVQPLNGSGRVSLKPPPNIEQVDKPLTSKSAIR